MKMKFKTQRLKDEFFLKIYEAVTDSLYDSDIEYIKEVYKDLDENFRYGKFAEKIYNEVLWWVESYFEDSLYEVTNDWFEVDWSDEVNEFLDKYWLDLIKEMDEWFRSWD